MACECMVITISNYSACVHIYTLCACMLICDTWEFLPAHGHQCHTVQFHCIHKINMCDC